MRTIKFRAWDTSDHIWLDVSANCLRLGGQTIVDANGWPWAVPGRAILEQFTGLHDKNGREIYEGDYIEFYRASLGTTVAVRHKVEWWGSVCGFQPFCGNLGLLGKEVEVIGNIHENPELLK